MAPAGGWHWVAPAGGWHWVAPAGGWHWVAPAGEGRWAAVRSVGLLRAPDSLGPRLQPQPRVHRTAHHRDEEQRADRRHAEGHRQHGPDQHREHQRRQQGRSGRPPQDQAWAAIAGHGRGTDLDVALAQTRRGGTLAAGSSLACRCPTGRCCGRLDVLSGRIGGAGVALRRRRSEQV
ncbi:MAG: hypothetical protein EA340_08290 [Nitriliruptor sp.]|nr:MAG: hypothetical protein EA340_08290 [Nitriliruptor sp.]